MIEIRDVSKVYSNGNRALQNINIDIDDGEFVFIMGRSGSGKTTLLRLMLKEMEPDSGSITINEQNLGIMPKRYIPKFRRKLGVVFQDFRLLNDRNVYENIAFAQRVIDAGSRQIKENVPEALKLIGLSSKYKSMPEELSGGEKQRVAIARAIVNKPELLLCDEPTGNLDSKTAGDIMRLLEEINASGTTVIVITHSHEIVKRLGKRVITLDRGVLISDKRAD